MTRCAYDVHAMNTEKASTGIIIVDHGSRRSESNDLLLDVVKMFERLSDWPIVEPAHMELAEPSIADAFDTCVARGAKRVIMHPYFLLPGRHWKQDIPELTAQAAEKHPGIPFIVTAPLGLHEMMVSIMNDRIDHCLASAEGQVGPCAVCGAESNGCEFKWAVVSDGA